MPLDVEAPRTPLARSLKSLESLAPARLRGPIAQIRRDLAVVEGRLFAGEKPNPLVRSRRHAGVAAKVDTAPRASSDAPPATLAAAASAPVQPAPMASGPSDATDASEVTLHTPHGTQRFSVKPGRYLLESALEGGATIPFSCTLGGCGTCKVRLIAGQMELEEPNCLTPEELDAGVRLSCVGRVVSPTCELRLEPGTEA